MSLAAEPLLGADAERERLLDGGAADAGAVGAGRRDGGERAAEFDSYAMLDACVSATEGRL